MSQRAARPGRRDPMEFRFRAGRISIDLTATVGKRGIANLERLGSTSDLERWLVDSGLSAEPVAASSDDLRDARALREGLYRLFTTCITGATVNRTDIVLVNGWAAKRPPMRRLQVGRDGELLAAYEPPTVSSLLGVVARDAIDLLGSPLRDRIRECEREDCTLLFLDASATGRRRWCSMDDCGVRSKMAAYRRRRAAVNEGAPLGSSPT